MPDYKRLVSYIYNYEDGVKRNNVGYARVEARNGQCKCTLHITAPSINDKQLKAYMYQRKKGGPEGILLGVLQIKNGIGDYKVITDPSHIMNSAYSLDDMGGILLYLSDRKFFATEWDDNLVTMKMVAEIVSREAEKTRRLSQAAEAEKERRLSKEAEAENERRLSKEAEAENERKLSKEAEAEKARKLLKETEAEKERKQLKETDKESQLSQEEELEQEVKAADIAVLYLDSPSKKRGEVTSGRVKEAEKLIKRGMKEATGKLESEKSNSLQPKQADKVPEQHLTSVAEKAPGETELHSEIKTSTISETINKNSGASGSQDQDESDNSQSEESSGSVTLLEQEEGIQKESKGSSTYGNSTEYLNSEYGNSEVNDLEEYAEEINTEEVKKEGTGYEEVPSDSESQKGMQSEEFSQEESGKFYDDHPIAKRIYRSFPRMYPFEDNEIAWCVKIEPKDIGIFPMESWPYGNNSFLLHGYYSYRHLIFAKINDKNGFNYILGVPGIYHNREKFMARMFGFENFKCVKRKAQRTGEFGYWYVPIVLT